MDNSSGGPADVPGAAAGNAPNSRAVADAAPSGGGPISKKIIGGILPALITPLTAETAVDGPALRRLLRWILRFEIDGLFLAGTGGEGLLVPTGERKRLLEIALGEAGGRKKVAVHVGGVSFPAALELARHAKSAGADVIAAIPPIYYKYDDRELESYFLALAEAAELPLLLYSIDNTGNRLPLAVVAKAAEHPNVIGIKWSHTDYYALERLTRLNGGNITVLNGFDETLLAGLAAGADGAIGLNFNSMPGLFAGLYGAFRAGDLERARELQRTANDVIDVIYRYGLIRANRAILASIGLDTGAGPFPARKLDGAEAGALLGEVGRLYDFAGQRPLPRGDGCRRRAGVY
jgi:N-acetylneuraminate lyase